MNLVNGGADTVNALLDHPAIAAVTFVGSTPVARHIYSRASANGKRVQAQGGAKNPLIILPDADVALTTNIVVGQRVRQCGPALPGRLAGRHGRRARTGSSCQRWPRRRPSRVVGYGLDAGRADGAGDHAAEQGADRGPDPERAGRGRRGWSWTAATRRSRAMSRATSCGRRILSGVPAGRHDCHARRSSARCWA